MKLKAISEIEQVVWTRADELRADRGADFVAVCGLFYGLLAGKDTHFPGRRVGIPHEQMDLIMSYKNPLRSNKTNHEVPLALSPRFPPE